MVRPSLSRCAYFDSAFDKEQGVKAIGFSVPSDITCNNTAPMTYGEASHDTINSLLGSKCTSKFCDVNCHFASSKATFCGASHDHCLVFCKRLYRGASVLVKTYYNNLPIPGRNVTGIHCLGVGLP